MFGNTTNFNNWQPTHNHRITTGAVRRWITIPNEVIYDIEYLGAIRKKKDFNNEMPYVDPYELSNSLYDIKLNENKLQH